MRKLAFLSFIILLVVVAVFCWRFFFQKVWDGKNKINLVFITPRIFIFSLDPSEKRGIILSLPQKTFIETIHGYGDYPLESVYKLGEQEGYSGGEFLTASLQENLRIPLNGYALVSNLKEAKLSSKPRDFILECFRNLFLGRKKTNLTKGDVFFFWFKLKRIRQDKVSFINLEKLDITEKIIFPDGTEGFKINPQKFKTVALEFFKDDQIRQENLEIAVLNSTSYPGLATRVADSIENIGGRVVEIGELENEKLKMKNEKCEIRGKKELKKSYTLGKLEKVFGCQWQEEESGGYRGDLVLIVGEGYWKILREK